MKFNIDNLFKTKLHEINYDFKPEYWKEMEQLLEKEGNAGTVTGGGFFSSLFFKTAITLTIAFLIGLFSFLYLGNKTKDISQPERKTEKKIIKQTPNTEAQEAPCNEEIILPKTEGITTKTIKTKKNRETIKIDYVRISPTIIDYIGAKLDKELDLMIMRNLKPYIIEDDPLKIEDEIIYPENVSTAQDAPNAKGKVIEKPDPPKNVRPMNKPVKRVFKKRKGLLWYLGFRR